MGEKIKLGDLCNIYCNGKEYNGELIESDYNTISIKTNAPKNKNKIKICFVYHDSNNISRYVIGEFYGIKSYNGDIINYNITNQMTELIRYIDECKIMQITGGKRNGRFKCI